MNQSGLDCIATVNAGTRTVRKAHPQKTPSEVAATVIEFSLCNPIWGCCQLAKKLKQRNILISSPTVQKILINQQMGSQRERAARILERGRAGQALTSFQMLQVERILGIKI